MKKLLYILPFTILLGACSSEAASDESTIIDSEPTTMKSGDEEEEIDAEPEVIKPSATNAFVESVLGEWICPASAAGYVIDLSINMDGSMTQIFGSTVKKQTFNALSGDRMEIINEEGEVFQTWQFKNITENSMDIIWNPEAEKPKTLPYTRKEK